MYLFTLDTNIQELVTQSTQAGSMCLNDTVMQYAGKTTNPIRSNCPQNWPQLADPKRGSYYLSTCLFSSSLSGDGVLLYLYYATRAHRVYNL